MKAHQTRDWEAPILSGLDFSGLIEGAVLDTLHDDRLDETERALVVETLGQLALSATPMLAQRRLVHGHRGLGVYARLCGLTRDFKAARRG